MSKREYELPIHDVIMGVGLGARADRGGWNNPKETLATAADNDTEVLLNQREEERREMTSEDRNRADELAIRGLYEKYKQRASDESLSPDDRDKWSKAALDLEFRNPNLFND